MLRPKNDNVYVFRFKRHVLHLIPVKRVENRAVSFSQAIVKPIGIKSGNVCASAGGNDHSTTNPAYSTNYFLFYSNEVYAF
tara:strand:- start:1056 stop:1298 length:243 start_codon:yes stop_codon:yes gene_type:complete